MKNSAGMTLIELMIVITVVAIMGAMATPFFFEMIQSARYRDGGRTVASLMRDARAQAVTTNQRHQVVVDLDTRTLDLQREVDDTWSSQKTLELGPFITLKGAENDECGVTTGKMNVVFHPNGSATFAPAALRFVCLYDQNDGRRLRAGVASAPTGRVVIQKPAGTGWQ